LAKYISYDLFLGINRAFQSLNVLTDEGLVFESIRNQTRIIIKEDINDLSIYPNDFEWPRTLMQIGLRISNSLTGYNRKYIKAQEFAADMGGIISFLLIVGRIIVSFTTRNMFYFEMINRFEQEFRRSEHLLREKYFCNFGIRNNHFIKSDLESETKKINKLKREKGDKKITSLLSSWEILKMSFNCHNKNKKNYSIFKEKKQEFQSFLDVESLFKLYKNFSFLKHLLLSEEQITAFRTNLILDYKEPPESEENLEKNIEKNIGYFKRNINSDELGMIDSKLISYLKRNFFQIFENSII